MSKNDHEILVPENVPEASSTEIVPHLIVDRLQNELTLIRDSGESVSLKAHIIDSSEDEIDEEIDEESIPPMSSEDFETAVRAVDRLGLTWTAGMTPGVKAKSSETESNLLSDEFEKLQDAYPRLPYEVYLAASYYLTQSPIYAKEAGGIESLERKAEIAKELIVTPDYRREFFFQSSIKVPYLKDIDWEVVFKLHERGVKGVPGIAYGLLALTLQDPFFTGRPGNARNITVAVDERLTDYLLKILNELKSMLASATRQSDILSKSIVAGEEEK